MALRRSAVRSRLAPPFFIPVVSDTYLIRHPSIAAAPILRAEGLILTATRQRDILILKQIYFNVKVISTRIKTGAPRSVGEEETYVSSS